MRRLRGFQFLFSLACCAGSLCAQQGTSTMLGAVSDPADATVASAVITVTELATGAVREGESSADGLFRFNNLPPGAYKLRVQAKGFKALELGGIDLASSETRNLGKLVLHLGALTEQVTVTAQVAVVQTASSERSALVSGTHLNDLSLKGRDPFGYLALLPGVVDLTASRDLESAYSMDGISINGMISRSKNVAVDGFTEMDEGGNYTAFVTPNQDSIAEIRVLTNGYQAEYGRQAGGTINVVTKGGSQEFHGSGHWDHRGEYLNANTFFNNRQGIQRPLYRYMIAGYSFGGPVYIPGKWNRDRRRLFFFISQEFTRISQPTTTRTANMPTDAERSGDFSNTRNSAGAVIPIVDPATRAQFPGNKIPQSLIDPTGKALLNLFPSPNGYVNPAPGQFYTANYIASMTPFYHRRNDLLRFDANITSKLTMYYRYGNDVDNQQNAFTVAPGIGSTVRFLPGYIHGIHLTYSVSPTLVNEMMFGVGHDNYGFYHPEGDNDYFRTSGLNPPTMRPFPTGDLYLPYLPCASFSGGNASGAASYIPGSQTTGGGCGLTPYKNFNDNYVFQDDLSKLVGRHSFKVGVFAEYNSKIEPSAGGTYMGNFNFGSSTNNPLDAGHGYANALLGLFQSYSEASNRAVPDVHFWQIEGYVQDSWRVSKKLTLDFGTRWLNQHPTTDTSGYYSSFFPTLWTAAKAPRLYWPATINGKAVAVDPLTGNSTYSSLVATVVPGSGDITNGSRVNGFTGKGDFYSFKPLVFAPRFGFAWDPGGNGKTAVRGSFGIFYNRTYNNIPGSAVAPTVVTPTIYYSYINQIPQAAAAGALSPIGPNSGYGRQPIERAHQFNLTIQRDIGFNTVVDVAYVGNFDRHASEDLQLNPVPLGAYANPSNLYNNTEVNSNLIRSAYPGMTGLTYRSYSNSSLNYHALQTQAQHRLSHGLSFGLSYTLSKALGTQGFDNYHKSREWSYGPTAEDRRHILTA